MKQKLINIVNNECKHLSKEMIARKQVILVKLNADGSVDQDLLSHGFVDIHGKQGPGLAYVVTLNQLQEELEGDYAGNPARRYFIKHKAEPIFEVKAFGDHRDNLVIFADHSEESQND